MPISVDILTLCRYEVMRSCWDADPKKRPTFSQLVTNITSSLNSLSDYLDVSTFLTEEQEIETDVIESPALESEECNVEASQDARYQTAETHFQGGHVPKNEGVC